MKNVLVTFLFLMISINSIANKRQQRLLELAEQQRYNAMIAIDTSALATMMAPSLVYYHSNGKLDTKQSLLQSIATKELIHQKITIEEKLVRIYQRKCGIVSGKCTYQIIYHDVPMTLHFVFTNVYTKLQGKWILVSRQTTKIDYDRS